MIKFTRLLLTVKESTLDKIEQLRDEYQEQTERAEMLNLNLPTVPKYTLTLDDYDIKETPYYVRDVDIIELYKDADNLTCITVSGGQDKHVYLKEEIEEVLKHIK